MVADRNGLASKSKGAIIGIAVGCGVLVIALVGAAVYALVQRRRAQKATEELGGPFGKQNVFSGRIESIFMFTGPTSD